MLELVERHSTGRSRLLRLLHEVESEGWCERTLYISPASVYANIQASRVDGIGSGADSTGALAVVLEAVGESDTGIALFMGEGRAVAVCPPFPLGDDGRFTGLVHEPLIALLDTEYVIGVVLVRLGRYAVGVLRGDRLIASKTAARYMKNRHRAGGQSQRRFERSRERLIRELYDKTCETAKSVFAPYTDSMDYLLLGGENSTLSGFSERCRLMRNLAQKTLARRLSIDQPNQKTLDNIAFEAWKSRVYSFMSVPAAEPRG